MQVSTQTETMDHDALSDALHSLRMKGILGESPHT